MISINSICIIVFIAIVFYLIYRNRKKFEFQKIGSIPIVAVLKTKFGINFINKVGKKHSEFLKILGYVGIVIGFAGLVAMFGFIVYYFIKLFTQPAAPSGVGLVVPGVKIPGSAITIPFWYGIIALFIVVVIHEAGHGIIAKAHKLKIRNTGFVLFAILPGAFVEPDEKQLSKSKKKIQQSVYAAGPWFNIILGFVVLGIFLLISPAYNAVANNSGFSFSSVDNNSPAMSAGLPANTTFNYFNGTKVLTVNDLILELEGLKPNDSVTLTSINNKTHNLTLGVNPQDNVSAYIGIRGITQERNFNNSLEKFGFTIFDMFIELLIWIQILSWGIGSANLLPIGPLDGGRMFYTLMRAKFKEKKAKFISAKVTLITAFMLIALIVVSFIKGLIGII